MEIRMERDELKFTKEKTELVNKARELEELVKAKDTEIANKEDQVKG